MILGDLKARTAAWVPPQDLSPELCQLRAGTPVPAVGAIAVSSERVLGEGVCGLRLRGSVDPVLLGDRWHLGSCTKAITAILIATYVRDGRMSWALPVRATFADAHPNVRDVTVAELVRHRGGLAGYEAAAYRESWKMESTAARALYCHVLATLEPTQTRGTYHYQNANFDMAAYMVERLTGEPWRDAMRQRIFTPLGLSSAGFGPLVEPSGHKADGTPTRGDNPVVHDPAGRLHMSLRDWGHLMQDVLKGMRGEESVLNVDWAELQRPTGSYSAGWDVGTWGEARVWSHSGSNLSWLAKQWVCPEKNVAMCAVMNTTGSPVLASVRDMMKERYL